MRSDEKADRPIGMICVPIRNPSVFDATGHPVFVPAENRLRVSGYRPGARHQGWLIEFETLDGQYKGVTPDVDFLKPLPPLLLLAEATNG